MGWHRLCSARAQEASIAPYTPHSHPAPTASTAPSPPHTPRTASSTSPPHLARLRPLQAAPKEDGKLSYAHTRFEFCEMPELSSTGHPVAPGGTASHTSGSPAHTCIVSSYGKCKRYSTYSWRFTDKVSIDIQHPLLGRR